MIIIVNKIQSLENLCINFKKQRNQMEKFQDLLTEAAQLKQQQLKQERKNFEALPEYLKSGLNYAKKYVQLRKQHYFVQKYISQKLKEQGNDQYLLENYAEALSKYQEALSVFRFIHATKYENLKDQDIIYENYTPKLEHKNEHETHLVALYLNICSVLTKMNKLSEAVHSSEEAIKLNSNNPKIYYKKAQAYLQYINKESADIKVGFYYLNKAYELSKDQSILAQMHKIKKQLDEEREKQKKWFKFMFDKNKQTSSLNKTKTINLKENGEPLQCNSESKQMSQFKLPEKSKKDGQNSKDQQFTDQNKPSRDFSAVQGEKQFDEKNPQLKQQLERFRQQNLNEKDKKILEVQKLEKTKQFLKSYLIIPRDDRWLIKYQQDFIHKHGSKIYSILQFYNYSEYLIQFKSLLSKCLELKQAKVTAIRDEKKILDQKIIMYKKFVQWIKKHPIQKCKRYIERYELQTKWIKQNRGLPLDEIYPNDNYLHIKQKSNQRGSSEADSSQQTSDKFEKKKKQYLNETYSTSNKHLSSEFTEQKVRMQGQTKNKTKNKKQVSEKNYKNRSKTHGFKQQWELNCGQRAQQQNEDQVPPHLKGFLQNYEDFPNYQDKLSEFKKYNKKLDSFQSKPNFQTEQHAKNMEQNFLNIKQNPFSFVKTFFIILVFTLVLKLIF